MIDNGFWETPPDQEVDGYGEGTITLVFPPFQPYSRPTPASAANFAPHDPVRARAFAESFPTVEAILEELPLTDASPESAATRADLELVRVGCWGNVIAISDYALADRGLVCPLLDVTSALAERHPEARIIGDASVNAGETHVETAIHLPGGLELYSEGWPATDGHFEFRGSVHDIARAVGISREALAEEYIHLDEEPSAIPLEHFGRVLLWPYSPWGRAALEMSHFRVRHTKNATAHMEEIWLPD
ncbi:DUF6333 family protein [Saccharothrix deserti]|uniref:DUF6333 family protein n=1 Tax=Saccharothrix deserti TaxID=2593674 RepID=UPI00131AEC86|nr:DUF6333 family protein [Saccharothrix deserti]